MKGLKFILLIIIIILIVIGLYYSFNSSLYLTTGENSLLNELILPAVLGGVGGLVRGFVGLLKAISLRRKILWSYYTITVVVSVVIGVFIGIIFNFDYRLSLLAGYAGVDILEGIYKSFAVQKVYTGKQK